MCKKILILSIVCGFIISGVSIAEERRPAAEEQELRERIEEMRARAHEHEEEAKKLFAEAAKIEGRLEREMKFSESSSGRIIWPFGKPCPHTTVPHRKIGSKRSTTLVLIKPIGSKSDFGFNLTGTWIMREIGV